VRFRHVLGMGDNSRGGQSPLRQLAQDVGAALTEHGLTVAVAESCTGGLLGSAFTDQSGSSEYFRGGIVAYSDSVKRDQLGVPAALLAHHGAVSAEVAEAMADGARSRLATDFAVSITCIAGPDSDQSGKPVGLTYVGIASPTGTRAFESTLNGDRWSNRRRAAAWALELLLQQVRSGGVKVKTA